MWISWLSAVWLSWLFLRGNTCSFVFVTASCLFSCLAPHRWASPPCHVHPSSRPNRPLFEVHRCWLAWDGSLLFFFFILQVTQRDAISNRCHAFICSAGAWRGRGLWADPLGLRSTRLQRGAEAGQQAESHTWVFTKGEMLQCCNGLFTEMLKSHIIKQLLSELCVQEWRLAATCEALVIVVKPEKRMSFAT